MHGFGLYALALASVAAQAEPPPELPTVGLVAYHDPDQGNTDSGDLTEITQSVGVATFTPITAGAGPLRDDLGFGRMTHAGGTPGFLRATQFQSGDGMITTDPAVLATFGASTSDFTVAALTWTVSSNANHFVWGIGNGSSNASISGTLSGASTISLTSQSVGGTGTVSLNSPGLYTRTKYPTITVWQLTAGVLRIYVNDMVTPKLTTAFTWASNPNHTRFGLGCRPDLNPDLSLNNAMLRFFALYNRALSDVERVQLGRYAGYRGNCPIGGYGVDEIVWGEA